MLKGLNPLLTSDLLQILRAMGHGDELVLCDSNFPADQVARSTVTGVLVPLDGADVPQAADAILSVFPLDSFVEFPVYRMEVVGDPTTVTPVQQEFKAMVDKHGDREWPMGSIERYDFYDRARKAYAVVSTMERRPYGCFILVKGVIGPEGEVV